MKGLPKFLFFLTTKKESAKSNNFLFLSSQKEKGRGD